MVVEVVVRALVKKGQPTADEQSHVWEHSE